MPGMVTCVSPRPLTYCAIAPFPGETPSRKIWNFATGTWEAIPADGVPKPEHLRQLVAITAGKGSLGSGMDAIVPDEVCDMSGAYLCVLNCTSAGAITGKYDNLAEMLPVSTSPSVSDLRIVIAR